MLVPGGRVVVATWRPLPDVPFCRDLNGIAERHLGPVVDQRHAFSDAAALTAVLEEAGFRDVRVDVITRTIRFADPAAFFQMNAHAIVGMSPTGKAKEDIERGRLAGLIAEDSRELLTQYADGPGLAFELSTNAATGRARALHPYGCAASELMIVLAMASTTMRRPLSFTWQQLS